MERVDTVYKPSIEILQVKKLFLDNASGDKETDDFEHQLVDLLTRANTKRVMDVIRRSVMHHQHKNAGLVISVEEQEDGQTGVRVTSEDPPASFVDLSAAFDDAGSEPVKLVQELMLGLLALVVKGEAHQVAPPLRNAGKWLIEWQKEMAAGQWGHALDFVLMAHLFAKKLYQSMELVENDEQMTPRTGDGQPGEVVASGVYAGEDPWFHDDDCVDIEEQGDFLLPPQKESFDFNRAKSMVEVLAGEGTRQAAFLRFLSEAFEVEFGPGGATMAELWKRVSDLSIRSLFVGPRPRGSSW